jgi:serine/threonine-protein kinase
VWRQQQRIWREQVRQQRAARQSSRRPRDEGELPVRLDDLAGQAGLQERFDSFRRKVTSTVFLVTFLAFINLVTVPVFPWVIFPAMGLFGRLRRRWLPLAAAGVTWNDVWAGRLPAHLGGKDRKQVKLETRQRMAQARAEAREAARRGRVLAQWRDFPTLVKRIRRFRVGAVTAAGAAGVAAASLMLGVTFQADVMLAPFFLGGATAVGAGVYSATVGRRIRRAGLRLRDMLRDNWMERLKAADPRPRAAVIEEEVARLVPADVLAGPHGDTVRRAVADRAEVSDTFAKMSPTDRALLPDVTATVDALVGRVAMLAQALTRLDEDHPATMLAALEERLARVEAETTDTRDGERRLTLLQRQRETLTDLVRRRETLAGQLEHASLVLQSVRFDLLKLRSAGIQSALEDVTSATQEARALSREIGHVLEAAEEVRAL